MAAFIDNEGDLPVDGNTPSADNSKNKQGNSNGNNNTSSQSPMEESMSNFCECPVCLDIAEDAVEADCCHRIYCLECSKQVKTDLDNICPICRKTNVSFTISYPIRRMIGSMPAQCPNNCNIKLTRSSLKEHLAKHCVNKQYPCTVEGCNFKNSKTEYCDHIRTQHSGIMLQSFDSYNNSSNNNENNNKNSQNNEINSQNSNQNNRNKGNNGNNVKIRHNSDVNDCKIDSNNNNNNGNIIEFVDPRVPRRNENGILCRLGSNGKYYCGQRSNISCSCCDGNCGPTNGHNCVSCMKLDLKMKHLWIENKNSNNNNDILGLFGNNNNNNNNDNNSNNRVSNNDRYLVNTAGFVCKLETWRNRVKKKVQRQNVGFGMNLFFDSSNNNNNNNNTEFVYEIVQQSNFYCGNYCERRHRSMKQNINNTWDGYCGPSNGPSCWACQQMDEAYIRGSYNSLWQ